MEPEGLTPKILGMRWDTTDDTFRFNTCFARVHPDVVNGSRRPTQREMLSVAMSIFDPFDLLANFTITAKVINQSLWQQGIDWDDEIPENVNHRWQIWRAEIEATRRMKVPRCYSPNKHRATNLQLHIFADASETAFAAVAYWRIVVDGRVELSFISGEARCAPLKPTTVPRLELLAALLASHLMVDIKAAHNIHIDRTVMWSDSLTLIKWIRTNGTPIQILRGF